MGWNLTPALSFVRRGRSVRGRNGGCKMIDEIYRDHEKLFPLLGKERARVRFQPMLRSIR
jgi:hypothetical protein